jgi:hypothetical protein
VTPGLAWLCESLREADPHALDAVTRAAMIGRAPVELRHDDDVITGDARLALIERVKAGDEVWLEMDLVAYEQTPGERNRNCVRFFEDNLPSLAESFGGQPFLANHERCDTRHRHGTTLRSWLAMNGETAQIRQTVQLTRPTAVLDALRGLYDRFSIGWHNLVEPECSLCEAPIHRCVWDKSHWRGTTHDGQVVEWILRGEGVETSAVNVPAVVGARRTAIRRGALDLHGAEPVKPPDSRQKGEILDLARLCQTLSLPENASIDDAVEAIGKLERERALHADRAAEALRALEASRAEIQALTAARDAAAEKLASERADAIVAEAAGAGKITLGGVTEAQLRAVAREDVDRARAWVAELPVVTPVGQPLQTGARPPRDARGAIADGGGPVGASPNSAAGANVLNADGSPDFKAVAAQLSAVDLQVAARHGVTPEAYAETMWPTLAPQFTGHSADQTDGRSNSQPTGQPSAETTGQKGASDAAIR